MMIQMMDRNGDGKLSKNEIGGMDLESMLAQADMSAVKQYVPDIEKLIKKVNFWNNKKLIRLPIWALNHESQNSPNLRFRPRES